MITRNMGGDDSYLFEKRDYEGEIENLQNCNNQLLSALEVISAWLVAPDMSKATRSYYRRIAKRAIAKTKVEYTSAL